ncbi:hypothetical protein [Priestia megaterium]|uniref:hypothetical protein n=1 Tax=Priestia megaterium TaxID=1404 RepID=UPI002795BAE6|nr:hypothetical protein [Priestia megaterium]
MEEKQIDVTKIYKYAELPDKIAGRCNVCNSASFKNHVKNGEFIRKCNQCGLQKSI